MKVSLLSDPLAGPGLPAVERLLTWFEERSGAWTTAQFEAHEALPSDLMETLFDLGFFTLLIPESLGGVGATMRDFCRVVATAAEFDASLTVTQVPHSGMGCKSFLIYGSEEQKQKVLGPVKARRSLIAYAQTEPQAGSDFSQIRTTIRRRPDGRLVLNGSKIWITNGGWAQTIVVVAKCPDHSSNPDGLAFVYLDSTEPGLQILQPYDKMAFHASVTSELYFNDVVVDEDRLLGIPGKGLAQFNSLVPSGRMGVASGALGLLRRVVHAVDSWCASAGPSWRTDLETADYLVSCLLSWAARRVDQGTAEATLITGLTKIYATEVCWGWVQRAMEMAGPAAYGCNDGLSQVFREISLFRVTEGPNEVVSYRCGLDLLLADFRALSQTQTGVCELAPDWDFLRDLWVAHWTEYTSFLELASRAGKPMAARQLLLDRVVKTATALCVLASLIDLVLADPATASGDQRSRIRAGAHTCSRDFQRWCRSDFQEDQQVERLLGTLSSALC